MVGSKAFYLEDYTYSASALAFTTLLAIVPLVSVILSIMAMLPFFSSFISLAQQYVLTNFLPTMGATIQSYLTTFTYQASRLPIVGVAFLCVSATTLIMTVENTFDDIWRLPQRRKTFSAWLFYWSILILAPILIGFSLFAMTFVLSLSVLSGNHLQQVLQPSELLLLTFIINTLLFSLLYILLPTVKVSLRCGLLGGLLASTLFELVRKVFAIYVQQFPTYELIYGTLSIVPIFILWVYVSWVIVLYGALVTCELNEIKQAKT